MKDTSNELDYDVMSDQEWEEEPEGGESLSVYPSNSAHWTASINDIGGKEKERGLDRLLATANDFHEIGNCLARKRS